MITSAPALTTSRTFARTPSTPSHTPPGNPGYGSQSAEIPPLGSQLSLWPPVWLSIVIATCTLGPTRTRSSIAFRSPASAPPASRTVVMPCASVIRRFSGIRKKPYENGRCCSVSSSSS